MDEKEYRSTYQDLNPIRCVYEKAINSRICNCSQAERFNLADREGVSCLLPSAQKQCVMLMQSLREKARFVLQQTSIADQLPHNAEIKIQNGGIKGLVKVINQPTCTEQDIHKVVKTSIDKFNSLEELPYSELMQEISVYRARQRRSKK